MSADHAQHQAGSPRHGLPGHRAQWGRGPGGQPDGGSEQVRHVRVPGAGPGDGGAQGGMLGEQRQQAEDPDTHGEATSKVSQDQLVGSGAEEMKGK